MPELRTCIKCKNELPLGMFDDNWRHRTFVCKDCKREQIKACRTPSGDRHSRLKIVENRLERLENEMKRLLKEAK